MLFNFADNNFTKNFIKKQLLLAVYLLPFEAFVDTVTQEHMYHSMSKNHNDKGAAQKKKKKTQAPRGQHHNCWLMVTDHVQGPRTCSIKTLSSDLLVKYFEKWAA